MVVSRRYIFGIVLIRDKKINATYVTIEQNMDGILSLLYKVIKGILCEAYYYSQQRFAERVVVCHK